VANFIGHVNFFPGDVVDLSGNEMTFKISQGKLKLEMPYFPIAVGDRLKGVVRPESIDITSEETELSEMENVIDGLIVDAAYIGSIMRFTVNSGAQIIYVDESDPQYRRIFREGQKIKLIFKKRIHMLKD
jgi:ABC-type Fe3+/spermidine/putrescine transport system ATPase subunit